MGPCLSCWSSLSLEQPENSHSLVPQDAVRPAAVYLPSWRRESTLRCRSSAERRAPNPEMGE